MGSNGKQKEPENYPALAEFLPPLLLLGFLPIEIDFWHAAIFAIILAFRSETARPIFARHGRVGLGLIGRRYRTDEWPEAISVDF